MNKNKAVIGPGLFLLVMAIGRLILSHSRDEQLNQEQLMFSGIRDRIAEKQTRKRTFIDSLLQDRGNVFLYSNDTAAEAGWIASTPNANGMVRSVLSTDIDQQLETDDQSYNLSLALHLPDNVNYPLNANIVFNDSDTARRLYFMVFDSKDKLEKDSALLAEYPEAKEKFAATWGMGFQDISKVKVSNLVNSALKESVLELKKVDGFHIYMVGVEKDNNHPGITTPDFMRSVGVLNKFLNQAGMDTTHFHFKLL